MKVDCVCCAYNEADHIRTALESLRNQQGNPFDNLLVVDGGSDDGTQEIAREYADRVEVNESGGKLTDRDRVVREWAPDADVYLWADADRVYPPGWAAAFRQHFQDPGVVGVSGDVQRYDPDVGGDAFEAMLANLAAGPIVHGARLAFAQGTYLNGGNSAFRRAPYILAGGFNLDVDEQSHVDTWIEEELAFAQRLADHGRVVVDPAIESVEQNTRAVGRYLPGVGDDGFSEEIARGDRM